MDEAKRKNGFVTFLKRLLLISVFTIVTVLICYSCSAINKVSNYTINLKNSIGNIYETENQDTVLIINSETEAYLNTKVENYSAVYAVEQKENLLLLTRQEEEKTIKIAFLSLSEKELFWQNQSIILYRWEE